MTVSLAIGNAVIQAPAGWNPIDSPVDKVIFDGRFVSAGIAEIVGLAAQRKWEEWSGSNWSGGVLFFRGWPLAHFVIRQTLYERGDWNDWNALLPHVMRPPGGAFPKPLTVSHPICAQYGVSAVVIDAVRAPDQIDHGVWQIDLDVIEHRALRAGGAKVGDEQAEPIDPVEGIIKALREQRDQAQSEYDKLAGEGNL